MQSSPSAGTRWPRRGESKIRLHGRMASPSNVPFQSMFLPLTAAPTGASVMATTETLVGGAAGAVAPGAGSAVAAAAGVPAGALAGDAAQEVAKAPVAMMTVSHRVKMGRDESWDMSPPGLGLARVERGFAHRE